MIREPAQEGTSKNDEGWIGYNSKVAKFDFGAVRARFVRLDWVFFEFLCRLEDGSVIVIYELGACRIDRSGKVLWNYSTDIVTEFSDDGDVVLLSTD